jgi:hypothetical protein
MKLRHRIAALLLGAALAALASDARAQQPQCTQVAYAQNTTASTIQLLPSGHYVICGWSISTIGTSPTGQIFYGTGGSCSQNTASITPLVAGNLSSPNTFTPIPFGMDLCFGIGGTVTEASATLYYATQ